MSESYHATYGNLKRKSRKEIEEMATDPDSVLAELAKKSKVKKDTRSQRRLQKIKNQS